MKRAKMHEKWARWCRWVLAAAATLMAISIAIVLTVDPYQMYHRVFGGRPYFDLRIQRFLVPGLARTSDYQIALLGTSMLQNIPNSAAQRLCGGPAVNLCLAGASIHEEALVLALALKHEGTRHAILTLDYNSLSGGSVDQVIGVNLPFPTYLYDDSLLDKFPYYLSWDSLAASFRILAGMPGPEETVNADWPWKFPPTMVFNAKHAVRDIDPAAINRNFGMTNLKLDGMEKAFADNLFPILEKERKSRPKAPRIHFVFPPYSILVWHDYAQRGQIQTYFAFRKWLIAQQERFRVFDIIDFQDRADIIMDLSRYADIYHYDEAAGEEIVAAACHGSGALNAENVDTRTRKLQDLIASTDPRQIVENVRGH